MPPDPKHKRRAREFTANTVVSTDDCIEWDRGTASGYGYVCINSKRYGVHVLAYAEVHGPIPNGMFVCHHCDNPPCFNVDHLFLGTQKDNVHDMIAKGRHRYLAVLHGEKNHNAKLTEANVADILRGLAAGISHRALARSFGVWHGTIDKIAAGTRWTHVSREPKP